MVGGRSCVTLCVVAAALASCGPAVDIATCTDPPPLEITHPDELRGDLVDAAVEHAQARLDLFMTPLHGYAFEGRFESTSQGEMVSSTGALGLLQVADSWVRLRLSDLARTAQVELEYDAPTHPDRITPGDWGVVCPADLAVPEPGKPFRLPPTFCEAMERGNDTELSIDVVPVAAEDIEWADLLFLNDLRTGGTPHNSQFESGARAHTTVDQASYKSGTGDSRVYVDYQARWEIEQDCLANHAIVTIDILHAERCDISGHTHGRYDSYCVTIATVDGRPDWANGF